MNRLILGSLIVVSAGFFSLFLQPVSDANAEDKGNLISNTVFTNQSTMNESQIQNFINSFPQSCLLPQNQPSGLSPVTFKEPLSYFTYGNDVSPARIIWKASQMYGLNPQVLLATLEKEQNLVSGAAGCAVWKYNSSLGYNCPDGSENALKDYPNIGVYRTCVAQESNATFSRQVNHASWQFRFDKERAEGNLDWGGDGNVWYYGRMTQGNRARQAGQPVTYYDGYTVIDGVSIYLANGATASLYNYTPHFNNFYTIFTRWFGSTQYGDLVRTVDNATVYLVSNDKKYPIADVNTLNALYPLGNISYVSQSYVDSKVTGSLLGRIIRSSNGTIYFYDAGIKLAFGSCAQVEAYGSTCGASLLLEDSQINRLFNGPNMTSLFGTTTGKTFYIENGTKREVYDSSSLVAAGISGGANVLNESAIANLSYGAPVIKTDVLVKDRSDGAIYAYFGSSLRKISEGVKSSYDNVISRLMDPQSVAKISKAADLGGYIQSSAGLSYLVTDAGKIKLTSPSDWQKIFIVVPDALINQINDASTVDAPYFIKTKTSGTVYLVNNGQKRVIQGWGDVLALDPTPIVLTLSDYYIDGLTDGQIVLSPGGLVKTATDATVYMIDGLDKKVPLNSFNPSNELGFNGLRTVSDSAINAYTTTSYLLAATVSCGAQQGVAINGVAYRINVPNATYVTLSAVNCNLLTWKDAPGFLVGPNGTIYQVSSSQKRPISGYQKYLDLGGNSSNTIKASGYIVDMFPTGALL